MDIPKRCELRHVAKLSLLTIRIYFDNETGVWYRRDTNYEGKMHDFKTMHKPTINTWLSFVSARTATKVYGQNIPVPRKKRK